MKKDGPNNILTATETKEDIEMSDKYVKRYSISYIRKM